MDPLSQAGLGASLSQSFASDKSKQLSALLIGGLAGMAPDLDVLIYSTEDPLFFLEYHRQFTHSFVFIPFGALLCSLVLCPLFKSKLTFLQIYFFAFLGYATHGTLDACTSYGTQLFWPFSSERFAWSTVSIIDPLFTIPVVILVLLAAWRKKAGYARIAFAYAVVFLCLGFIQHNRAEKIVVQLAQQRGHQVERVQVKPSFANRHVWKLIYEHEGRFYVDAVRLLWRAEYIAGSSIEKLDVKRDYPWLPEDSQQAVDIERFRWFSDDFLAVSPHNSKLIMDVRYSYLPNCINSLWGVELSRQLIDEGRVDSHVKFEMKKGPKAETVKRFIEMVF